jgi:hypothetical protein
MTRGATGIGGRPVLQERANPHRTVQIRKKRVLFNPVINVLMAQILVQGVRGAAAIVPTRQRD